MLTFEQWKFETGESDLEEIRVLPFVDDQGKVQRWSKLAQNSPGEPLRASVGPKGKVTVKWTSVPEKPEKVQRWVVELIPSVEEYGPEYHGDVDFPSVRVSRRQHQATVPLEIELEEATPRCVQLRVTGLDGTGAPICDAEGKIIEALSQEFWLEQKEEGPVDSQPVRRSTVPTRSFALLEAAAELRIESVEELTESPEGWQERDLDYFSVRIANRRLSRVGIVHELRELERLVFDHPEDYARHRVRIPPGAVLMGGGAARALLGIGRDEGPFEQIRMEKLWSVPQGERLLRERKEFFRGLARQETERCMAAAAWNDDLSKAARRYANAYGSLLTECAEEEVLAEALSLDTVEVVFEKEGQRESAVLVLPTHPLRAVWYAAYCDLLARWLHELLEIPSPAKRRRLIDLELVKRLEPLNIPFLVLNADGEPFVFAQNLRFFHAVCLPIDALEPRRRIARVATVFGMAEDEATVADVPPAQLSEEFLRYRDIHPHLESMRLNVLNPGSGRYLGEALRALYQPPEDDERVAEWKPPRLEILAHTASPLPLALPGLRTLQEELYRDIPSGRYTHLAPFCQVAIRPEAEAERLPGGDVHLTVVMDSIRPTLQAATVDPSADSCSFYGLLMRLLPYFESSEGTARWEHRMNLPASINRERHPVIPSYTNTLVDGQRAMMQAILRCQHISAAETETACLVVELGPEKIMQMERYHHLSDWVVSLERFSGIDLYDNPRDVHWSRLSRKYLLDYVPEFLDGLGHRMLVTTSHREEIEEMLRRAMHELGFAQVDESVGVVLQHLKGISGRLALHALRGDASAREAVALGVTAAYLRRRGELEDSILIPVDAHKELFGPAARKRQASGPALRCDLIRIRLQPRRLHATFIEVKSRASARRYEEAQRQICDQLEATERVFRDLFFSGSRTHQQEERIDHALQRSRLLTILRFYLARSYRYGLIRDAEKYEQLKTDLHRLE
ncbi:MAG TPA: hypothetical protein EYP14_20300, partial [Planctomycetaceae bacterium]|nr:hypothetical protein [Planctomycetaceae bacterium]